MPGRFTPKSSGPVRVTYEGSVFDGSLGNDIRRAQKAMEDELAELAVSEIRARLGVVLRHPTGHYRSKIRAERRGETVLVTDSNVIYGPWLEGVGTRNRTTRFKGYSTFRRTFQDVNGKAPSIADRVLGRYVDA